MEMWNHFYTPSCKKLLLLCGGKQVRKVLFINLLVRDIFLCDGKQVCKIFLILLIVRDTGADCTSQNRSEFDWYYPHLYNYWCISQKCCLKENLQLLPIEVFLPKLFIYLLDFIHRQLASLVLRRQKQ